MDIHQQGGGIHYTVNCVRQASPDQLYASLINRLSAMLRCGTTVVEAKSGYGLDTKTEIKMLQVLNRAQQEHPISLSITYCGAHAVPKYVYCLSICPFVYYFLNYRGSSAEEATDHILQEQIPAIVEECAQDQLHVDNIDVFCEKGVFDRNQSREILLAGKKAGWKINFHGDELHPMQCGEV